MNIVLEFVLAIILTALAHVVLTFVARAIGKLGTIATVGIQGAASSTFQQGLNSDNVSPVILKGLIRSQLIGTLPSAVVAIGLAVGAWFVITPYTPNAAWVTTLWAFATILYALSLIRQSFWWFARSFFVKPESLAEEMHAWHQKH